MLESNLRGILKQFFAAANAIKICLGVSPASLFYDTQMVVINPITGANVGPFGGSINLALRFKMLSCDEVNFGENVSLTREVVEKSADVSLRILMRGEVKWMKLCVNSQ